MAQVHAKLHDLPDEMQARIESWVIDFDQSWSPERLGEQVSGLPKRGSQVRACALVELIKVDIERQWSKGKRLTIEDYLETYPELGTKETVAADLIQAEYEVRRQFGAPAKLTQIIERFPKQAAEIRRLVDEARELVSDSELDQSQRATNSIDGETPSMAWRRSHPEKLPEEFGRYHIVKQIGQGGMGTVYLAEDSQLNRQVALKVPRFAPEDGPDVLARFYREARAAATIEHPNICPVHDVGEIDGINYLTMMYVDGKPLSEFVRSQGPLPERQIALVVRKLALALQEAHRKGVVHRDLKPANVMVNRRSEPVIMDFGLARNVNQQDSRLTDTGTVMGTPAYMPPEQVAGDLDAMGPGSDIYSLGVIFFELLTGELPFVGTVGVVLGDILHTEPPSPKKFRPDVDPVLEGACLKAMAKDPQERFADMTEFAEILTHYLRGERLMSEHKKDTKASQSAIPNPQSAIPSPPEALGDADFDAYHRWLGIPKDQRPPTYYQMLGISPTETDREVINEAVIRQSTYLRTYQRGAHADLCARLLEEVAQAGQILANPKKRKAYDAGLKRSKASKSKKAPSPPAPLPKEERGMERPSPGPSPQRGEGLPTPLAPPGRGAGGEGLSAKERAAAASVPTANEDREVADFFSELAQQEAQAPSAYKIATTSKPKRARSKKRRPQTRKFQLPPKPWLITAAVAAGVLLLASIIYVTLPGKGRLEIEFNGEEAQVAILQGGKEIEIVDSQTGSEVRLKEGKYELKLKGEENELTLSQDTITMSRAGAVIVRVERIKPGTPGSVTARASVDGRTGGRAASGTHPTTPTEPADALQREQITPHELKTAGQGEPERAPPGLVAVLGDSRFNHWGWVRTAVFGPKGNTCVSADYAGTIAIWDASSGRLDRILGYHDWVRALAVSPDGTVVATGSGNGQVKLWDWDTGRERLTIQAHTGQITSVAFSPDGRMLATAGAGKLRLWNVATGKKWPVEFPEIGGINSVAISPDGKVVATSHNDRTVKLWESDTAKRLGQLNGHPARVSCIAFDDESKRLVSGCFDGTVIVWKLGSSPERVYTLTGHTGPVNSLSFAGPITLVSGSNDQTAIIWGLMTGAARRTLRGFSHPVTAVDFDSKSETILTAAGYDHLRLFGIWGQPKHTISGHTSGVRTVSFSPDGAMLASGSADRTVRIWDLASGRERQLLLGHKGFVSCVEFSPDGGTLASASWDGALKLWDAERGQLRKTIEPHTGPVGCVTFSPDGTMFATCSSLITKARPSQDHTIKLWNAETGQLIRTLLGHKGMVYSTAFSPDGRLLASSGHDQTVRIWNVDTGQQRAKLDGKIDKPIPHINFSPDGRTLATAGGADQAIRLWDVETGGNVATLTGHEEGVWSAVFHPRDNALLASSGEDGTVRLWDAHTHKLQQTIKFTQQGTIARVAVSPSGRYLATANGNGTVYVLRMDDAWTPAPLRRKTAAAIRQVTQPPRTPLPDGPPGEILKLEGHTDIVGRSSISPDGRFVVSASSDRTIRLWDLSSGKEIRQFLGHEKHVTDVKYSPDGTQILSSSMDHTTRLWDVATGGEIRKFRSAGAPKPVNGVAFSPDGTKALTGDDNNLMRLWDVSTGQEIRQFTGHTKNVLQVVFAPDGRTAFSAGGEGAVRHWDLETGQELRLFQGNTERIYGLAVAPDGRLVASAGWDKSIRVWNVATGVEAARFTAHTDKATVVAFLPDNRHLASGSTDKTLRIWDVPGKREVHRFTATNHVMNFFSLTPDSRFAISGGGYQPFNNRANRDGDYALHVWRLPKLVTPNVAIAGTSNETWTSLFNGRNLSGWSMVGNAGFWSVEDGQIVGEGAPTKENPGYLVADKEYADFELKLKYMLESPGNSGVNFRNRVRADGVLIGYQAEIAVLGARGRGATTSVMGNLLDLDKNLSLTRSLVRQTPEARLQAGIDEFGWNDMTIRAAGNRVTVQINEVTVADYFDYAGQRSGQIRLELYDLPRGTRSFRIAFKDLRIRELSPADVTRLTAVGPPTGSAPLFDGRSLKGWTPVSDDPKAWSVRGGAIRGESNEISYLVTDRAYSDYVLTYEYRLLAPKANSGIVLRTPAPRSLTRGNIAGNALHVQILDDYSYKGDKYISNDSHRNSAVYDLQPPLRLVHAPAQQWNRMEVRSQGNRFVVKVNGTETINADLGALEAKAKQLGKYAFIARKSGHIGLEVTGRPGAVEFRNINLLDLTQPAAARAAAAQPAAGETPLFNGRDLAGWVNVNCKPDTFSFRNGVLYCNGNADGFIRTQRKYTNFILEVDWRHLESKGNSGLFIWSGGEPKAGEASPSAIEVQILDGRNSNVFTSHGDILAIHGTVMVPDRPHPSGGMRCLPSERRCRPSGQWNTYRLTCNDGTIKLAVNGKEVSGASQVQPRTGYIGLQSQNSPVEFRNIRIRELTASGEARAGINQESPDSAAAKTANASKTKSKLSAKSAFRFQSLFAINEPLAKTIDRLERFGFDVKYDVTALRRANLDPSQRRVTFKIPNNSTIEDVCRIVFKPLGLQYTIDGKTVTLTPAASAAKRAGNAEAERRTSR